MTPQRTRRGAGKPFFILANGPLPPKQRRGPKLKYKEGVIRECVERINRAILSGERKHAAIRAEAMEFMRTHKVQSFDAVQKKLERAYNDYKRKQAS
jgi:hypothetical protein